MRRARCVSAALCLNANRPLFRSSNLGLHATLYQPSSPSRCTSMVLTSGRFYSATGQLNDEELWALLDSGSKGDRPYRSSSQNRAPRSGTYDSTPRTSKPFGRGFDNDFPPRGPRSSESSFDDDFIPRGPRSSEGSFGNEVPKGPGVPRQRSRDFNSGDDMRSTFDINVRGVDWEKIKDKLPKFEKNFYKEHPDLATLSKEKVDELRKTFSPPIQVSGTGTIPKPVRNFEEILLPEFLHRTLTKSLNLQSPTPIQAQGIPIALSGRDMVGLAETGSGKTLAFLVPGIVHLQAQPPPKEAEGPIVLVLAPTRELAIQISTEGGRIAGKPAQSKIATLYGGAAKGPQISQLRRNPEVVVATPGRLLDLVSTDQLRLHRVTYLVIDEADRMLDMGFEPQLRKIIGQLRPDRQTLMWSATWPTEIRQLAMDFLRDPVLTRTNTGAGELVANPNVEQRFIQVDRNPVSKRKALFRILEDIRSKSSLPSGLDRVLIFCNTKQGCEELVHLMVNNGWPAVAIHGDKSQQQREFALQAFRSGQSPILVATDVAARGLDIKDVVCVINHDIPNQAEDYVHRIGRTGRAGAKGVAYSLYNPEFNSGIAKHLNKVIREAGQQPPDFLKEVDGPAMSFRSRKPVRGYGSGFGRDSYDGFSGGRRSFGQRGGYTQSRYENRHDDTLENLMAT